MDRTAGIAQMVEQLICNHQVPCSIHGAGTTFGDVAQLGEQLPCTHQVVGSIPIISTIFGRLAQLVRAVALHASGREFESLAAHHIRGIAQSGSASGLGPEGRRFESFYPDHLLYTLSGCSSVVEHRLAKARVVSSNLITRSILMLERCPSGRWSSIGNAV